MLALNAQEAHDSGLLERIRQHMRERLAAVPNYTCRETIERAESRGGKREFHILDTLLLEVAQVGGRELLAWPGERFDARPASAFASSGLMTNGAFSLQARGLFFGDRATWYAGKGDERDRKLVRYDYYVPLHKSGFIIKGNGATAIIPYHGFVIADPETLDAVRIEIFSDSIAKDIGMERADMVIEYQRVQIGSADALLPKSAEVITTLRRSKVRQRNRITFSQCRQYGSESVISFAAPVRLKMTLRIEAAGAIVEEDVKDGDRVLIPKGAVVRGKVKEGGIAFTSAEWDGGRAEFTADPISAEAGSKVSLEITLAKP